MLTLAQVEELTARSAELAFPAARAEACPRVLCDRTERGRKDLDLVTGQHLGDVHGVARIMQTPTFERAHKDDRWARSVSSGCIQYPEQLCDVVSAEVRQSVSDVRVDNAGER